MHEVLPYEIRATESLTGECVVLLQCRTLEILLLSLEEYSRRCPPDSWVWYTGPDVIAEALQRAIG